MKVEELEKEILESRQKIEFYRTKMQELVSTEAFFYVFSFFYNPWGIRGCYTYIRTAMECGRKSFGKMMLLLLTDAFPPPILNTHKGKKKTTYEASVVD